jgi:3-oxoacyl-[acyl-carrier protein] reductase
MSRAVLITGGSRGIGRAIVARFAGAGDHVLFSYGADDEGARRTQEQSPDALMHKADLRDPEAAQELMGVAVAQLGSVDVLVNCAGIFPHSPFLETPSDAVTDVLRVNVLAPFLLTQHAVAAMPEAGGAVVNVTSINAFSPDEGLAAYDASKAALAQITRTAALELGPRGVRVNAVAPGLVDDPTLAEAAPQRREAFLRHAPLGRLVQPQDIAHATYFLASDAAGAITGQTLVVDSGVTLAGYTAGG